MTKRYLDHLERTPEINEIIQEFNQWIKDNDYSRREIGKLFSASQSRMNAIFNTDVGVSPMFLATAQRLMNGDKTELENLQTMTCRREEITRRIVPTTKRVCLRCERKFDSLHKYNRICDNCKTDFHWRTYVN